MTASLDFWFEFASTYSYPAAMRIAGAAAARGVTMRWRPFLLGPIFMAQGWDNSPFNLYPVKGRYMWRDLERICAGLALPFTRPAAFPQNTLMAARVALMGLAQGWGEDFCRAAYTAEFGEGRDIGKPEHNRRCADADRAGCAKRDGRGAERRQQGAACARRRKKLRGSASSARRVSSRPTASCSGATTGSMRRWTGLGAIDPSP